MGGGGGKGGGEGKGGDGGRAGEWIYCAGRVRVGVDLRLESIGLLFSLCCPPSMIIFTKFWISVLWGTITTKFRLFLRLR